MNGTSHVWAVAGGGTGGHVTPALALAERFRARGDEVFLLGSPHGLETRLVPEAGFELVTLPSRQVMGQGVISRLRALVSIAAGCWVARGVLRARRARMVVSVGGYASVPAVVAAASLRIPVALVEPNARPGRANRLLARVASLLFVHFDEAAVTLSRGDDDRRLQHAGIPLRRALVDAFSGGAARRTPGSLLHLLVFGGSQGARQINEAMMEAAQLLPADRLVVVHQSGEADRERVAAAYAAAGLDAEVVSFEPDMPSRYRAADLAICRAGALTVAELAMAGLPALLVPYPHAADDHQTANARALVEAGAARLLACRPLSVPELVGEIQRLADAPQTLVAMGQAAAKLARPDAAERIVEACVALCDGGRG